MSRIDLNEPYEKYLQSLVEAGLYRSITAATEAAIHRQMIEDEKLRLSSIGAAIAKGEADIQAGRTRLYNSNLMAEISQKGKQSAIDGKTVKPDVRD
jgi:Arc/MetJ-type ribon-helix-helix transcriptional regulator